MALTRTWHSVIDIPLDSEADHESICTSILLAMKRCLTGDFTGGTPGPNGPPPVPWSVEYSSNATTAGPGDLWLTYDDVKHSDGNNQVNMGPRSWACFKSPAGKRFVMDRLRYSSNVTYSNYVRPYVGTAAPNNLGSISTSLAPEFDLTLFLKGNGPNQIGSINSPQIERQGTSGTGRKVAFTQSSDGEFWFFIVYLPILHPANAAVSAWGVWPITPRPGLTYPSPWAFLWPTALSSTCKAFEGKISGSHSNLVDVASNNATPYFNAILPDGLPAPVILPVITTASSNGAFDNNHGRNAFTEEYDGFPLNVSGVEAGRSGIVGVLEDIYLAHINAQGASFPKLGPVEHYVFGNWMIPFTLGPTL